ncbi:MAG: hypothetical protein LQ339_007320 [Xanthoria mediterranea]|nr:MAG: hypothetical protein LQ339_007320 [Xanthoria mediterranea]
MSRSSRCSYTSRSSMYYNDNSWTSKYTLHGGSAWESPYQRAILAFEIIMVIALAATLVFSILSRKTARAAKAMFAWFLATLSVMLFTSIFNFINIILNEECVSVQQVYLIFNVIFSSLRYLADVLLLATTFTYLIPRSILTRHATQSSRNLGPTLLHLLFCGLLGLFWLVITVILLAVVIQQVRDTGIVSNFDLINGVRKLDFTYNLLYFFAALEIVALAVMRLTSRTKDPNGSNEPTNSKRHPLLFLVLISLPLLIRSIWQLAIAARYELQDSIIVGLQREQLRLAQLLFYFLCTTLIYIGLALVIKQLGAETPFTNAMQETEEEKGKAGLGPEIPIMRAAAAPTPKLQPFDPYAPSQNSGSGRLSRDHSEDPIYNGP